MLDSSHRAVLVGVQLPSVSDDEFQSSLIELRRLAKTLGLAVIATVTQRRTALAKAAMVGPGKLSEIARYTGGSGVVPSGAKRKHKKAVYKSGSDGAEVEEEDEEEETEESDATLQGDPPLERASVVVVDHDLSPSQAKNLQRAVDCEVLDRTAVILAIFRRHARTREAQIEVEIARLNYMAPRLRELGGPSERQRGGIGGRGAGESSLEMDRRKVRDRIAELKASSQRSSVRRAFARSGDSR